MVAGNVTLLAFAAVRRAAAIDIPCLPGPQQQNHPHAAAAVNSWDRQTDGHCTVT